MSKIFSVAKIAKLLRRPRGRSVIRAQCQEQTGEKEMFSDVDGRQTEKKMLGCRMAMVKQSTCIVHCTVNKLLQSALVLITQFDLQGTPRLPLPRKRSPDGASTD